MFHITRRNIMRILNNDSDESLKNISIFLKKEEVLELRDTIEELLNNVDKKEYHLHLNDEDYSHEITFSIYSESNFNFFNERIQRLLVKDI